MLASRVRYPIGVALAALASSSCSPAEEGFARAYPIVHLDQAIGGPKAMAREGDFVLENEYLRVAVLGPRNSMGPGLYGGSLVDADLQWGDPGTAGGHGRDQFAELIPTVSMNVPGADEEGEVVVLKDGSDGQAVVRVMSEAEPFLTLLDALWVLTGTPDFHLVTDYVVEPGKPWVTVRTTAVVDHGTLAEVPTEGEPATYGQDTLPLLEQAIETGLALGDFYLSGGHVDVFAPGYGFDEDGAVYDKMVAGENTFTSPFVLPFVAGTGDGVSYGLASSGGNMFIPLFTASQTAGFGAGVDGDGTKQRFPEGAAYTYERWFFVGNGDIGSIVDSWVQAADLPHGIVRGHVLEEGTGHPLSGMDVFVFEPGAEKPFSQWETDVDPRDDRADGSFGGRLPVGDWELLVHRHGRPDSARVPITVEEGEEIALALASPRPGLLSFEVRDERGRLVPAKVSVFRLDDDPRRNPDLGDGFVAGAPEMVLFPMYGEGEAELPDGEYQAVASRGIEYELDLSEPFRIDASTRTHLQLAVHRSVETDGWISADFHVHAAPSHDSGVSLADRARTMVSEGVEFFSSTDHDYVTDYGPTVERLGLEEWVQTTVGVETTTVEIGHFLGFPLVADHLADAGGAMDWTAATPDEILDEIRAQGREHGYEPVVFVGHPRDGILGYFDQYGFDPYGGTPDNPMVRSPVLSLTNPLLASSQLSWDFDALELLNGKRMDILRTPTQDELDRFAGGEDVPVHEFLTRTAEEQQDLEDGVFRLGYGVEGQIDDWFTLLNLGFRYTALGNSDTHGWTGVESGCPRNFVMAETDDPAFLDDQAVADAVREHRVVASYGPFVQLWVDGQPIGSDVEADGAVRIDVEVQAPTWIDVDRVELYESGTLVHVWEVEETGDALRLVETVERTPTRDAWYVAIAMGDGDLAPVFTPVEIPYIELQMVVTEALGGVDAVSSLLSAAVPIPREYPVHPFAVTNPIWVDVDGGGWTAPGIPWWLQRPEEPEAD